MKSSVFKCIGLGLGLQGLLWGDFCDVCGMDHKIGQCPVETLKLRLDEFEVDNWDSDVEEAFVQEHELEAQRLRGVRNRHHCRTLKQELAVRTTDTGTLEVDPLNADRVYRALLEKCDRLLSEVTILCDLVQVLDMGQTCKVCKAAQAEEQRRREKEARKPKGVTGQQIFDYIQRTATPGKKNAATRLIRANKITPSQLYTNRNQIPPRLQSDFDVLMSEQSNK
ncbi:MAG: hypothetical protein ACLRFH_04095 [Opitutales bacterium]